MFLDITSNENIFDRKTIKTMKSKIYARGTFKKSSLLGNIDKKIEKHIYKRIASTKNPCLKLKNPSAKYRRNPPTKSGATDIKKFFIVFCFSHEYSTKPPPESNNLTFLTLTPSKIQKIKCASS
jgi:hypothetical protein